MTDRIDMSNHDVPQIEIFDENPEVNQAAERKALLGGYDPVKEREELGVEEKTVITQKKPQPEITKGSCMAVLTHIGVFSPPECQRIIESGQDAEWETANVQKSGSEDTPTVKLDIRQAKQTWIEKTKENLWLFDKMLALTMAANQQFKFEVDFFEALQLTKYEVGDFYSRHIDMGAGHMGNRKLGISVQLSAGEDYEGGDIVCDNNGADFVAPRELGSVTVFPSFMLHEVTPVTKGTRYSLVVWASGTKRFR